MAETMGGSSGDTTDKRAKGFSESGIPSKEFTEFHKVDDASPMKVPSESTHKEDKG